MMFSSKKFDLETMASLHVCNNEDGLMDEWNGQINYQMDGYVEGLMDGLMDGQMTFVQIDGWFSGCIHGCMDYGDSQTDLLNTEWHIWIT